MNKKSVQEVSKQKSVSKTDARYWKSRIFRNSYSRDGKRVLTADWCIKLAHGGRRETVNLKSSNAEAASARARDLYLAVIKDGWASALTIYKPQAAAPRSGADVTIGDLITAAGQRAVHLRATTLRYYQGCMRQVAADIAEVARPVDRYDYVKGGSARWRTLVDALPLTTLTPVSLREWQTGYVKARGDAPDEILSARTSANTILGSAARMFTPVMLEHYKAAGLDITESPFVTVKRFKKRHLRDPRYIRRIDPVVVLEAARKALTGPAAAPKRPLSGIAVSMAARGAHDRPQVYRVILLSTLTGLRRSELDRLQWSHIDFTAGIATVQSTADGTVKGVGSTRDVNLAADLVAALQEWKAAARELYVIECKGARAAKLRQGATYRTYRCARVFDKVNAWLRDNFLPDENHPLHTLRKEYGSLICQSAGIQAAADLLGHRDIRTASEYYVVRKSSAVTGLAVPFESESATLSELKEERKAAQ